jgi:hypothetical protein
VRAFAVPSLRIREVNPVLSENANHGARPLGEEGAVGAVRSLRQGKNGPTAISFAAAERLFAIGRQIAATASGTSDAVVASQQVPQ